MRFNLDNFFSFNEQAMYLRDRRNSLLASNIANADTPNYKAKDIDFRAVLRNVAGMDKESNMALTHAGHISPGGTGAMDAEELYRYPFQASLDGNTVDMQREKAEYAQNVVHFQASNTFLSGKFMALKKAIKGQ